MPLLAILIGQAINMAASYFSKGKLALPDAVPLVSTLVDALGHVTGETDEERAKRRADAEAIFAKHSASLLPDTPAGG